MPRQRSLGKEAAGLPAGGSRPDLSRAPARAGSARRGARPDRASAAPGPREGRGTRGASTTNGLDCKRGAVLYSRARPRGWEPRSAARAGGCAGPERSYPSAPSAVAAPALRSAGPRTRRVTLPISPPVIFFPSKSSSDCV